MNEIKEINSKMLSDCTIASKIIFPKNMNVLDFMQEYLKIYKDRKGTFIFTPIDPTNSNCVLYEERITKEYKRGECAADGLYDILEYPVVSVSSNGAYDDYYIDILYSKEKLIAEEPNTYNTYESTEGVTKMKKAHIDLTLNVSDKLKIGLCEYCPLGRYFEDCQRYGEYICTLHYTTATCPITIIETDNSKE